ncbi:MAG TPA: helix-turn-helix domain-containing protein [Kofleriaceae bacterium]|nr:helix-turn-helix domain-containing protein [Kofleriaceae bacterium]
MPAAAPAARPHLRGARRGEILDAALACFTARGVDATTIADIRERAGATTGSIYHFFAGKDALLGALYVDALRSYRAPLLARLARARSGRSAVRGIVEHTLDWVGAHPDAARFLFDARRSPAVTAVEADIRAGNRELFRGVRQHLDRLGVAAGRRMPPDLLVAILIGPVMSFAREHLAGHALSDLGRARRTLADAAWAAVHQAKETP